MNDIRAIPRDRPLDLQSSRYYDPTSMDVLVPRRESSGVVESKRDGAEQPRPVQRTPGDADRRDALKKAIRAYGAACMTSRLSDVVAAWDVCMQKLEQIK